MALGEEEDQGLVQKDIDFPEVEKVYVAAVLEENQDFRTRDWNAYLINARDTAIEMVLIVTKGYDGKEITSTMRHSIKVLPARSFAKVEFMQDEVLRLTNEFSVSFFADGKMSHKKFIFRKNSVKESKAGELPVMPAEGILAE